MKTSLVALLALYTLAPTLPATAATLMSAHKSKTHLTHTAPPHFDAGEFFEELSRNSG